MVKSGKNILMTRALLFGGLAIMLLLFLLSGIVSYSVMKNSTGEITEKVESLDAARRMQIEFQEQYSLLLRMLSLNTRDKIFNEKYHRFSYYHSSIKDIIRNLKIEYVIDDIIRNEIDKLDIIYDKVYAEYVSHFSMTDIYYKESDAVAAKQVINVADSVAKMIEEDVKKGIIGINKNYSFWMLVSLSILCYFSIMIGISISLKLSKITSSLDEAVRHRTEKIREEAEAHRQTAVKLENSLSEIRSAKEGIEVSERKYRHFVEDSGDYIFVLNCDFVFTDFNKAVRKVFRLTDFELENMSFFDLIQAGGALSDERELVRAKMDTFMKKLDSITFTTSLISTRMIEPLELNISFMKIKNGDKIEILGKASKKDEEIVLRFFVSESCEYEIGNKLLNADDVSNRIIMNLVKYMPAPDANRVRVGVRELIINAIEHGNLNISFEEKTKAVEQAGYIRFLSEKGKQPEFRNKKVNICYSLNSRELRCVIKDSGNGFDHKKIFLREASELNDRMLAHGRGLIMAKSIFDSVSYNEKGNEVTVIKRIS